MRLLNRTTRSVAPTDAGRQLQDRLEQLFSEIEQSLDVPNGFRDKPSGTLRLNVPPIIIMPDASTVSEILCTLLLGKPSFLLNSLIPISNEASENSFSKRIACVTDDSCAPLTGATFGSLSICTIPSDMRV